MYWDATQFSYSLRTGWRTADHGNAGSIVAVSKWKKTEDAHLRMTQPTEKHAFANSCAIQVLPINSFSFVHHTAVEILILIYLYSLEHFLFYFNKVSQVSWHSQNFANQDLKWIGVSVVQLRMWFHIELRCKCKLPQELCGRLLSLRESTFFLLESTLDHQPLTLAQVERATAL